MGVGKQMCKRELTEMQIVNQRNLLGLAIFGLMVIFFQIDRRIWAESSTIVNQSEPMTLDKCLELALQNSTTIKNSQINIALQNLRIKDARSSFYPNFSLSGNYTLSDQLRKIQRQRENLDKDTFVLLERGENYNFGLSGRYTIWDYGQRGLNLLREEESLESQKSRNERIRQNLIYDVTQAFYNVLKAQALVEVDKEVLQRSRDNRQRVEAFVQAGIQIEADVAAAQVREANDELNLLNDQNQLDIALARLPRVMGFDPSVRINITKVEEALNQVSLPSVTLDKAIEKALKSRPEFAENSAGQKRLRYSLKLARIDRLPTVDVEYTHNMDLDAYFDDFFDTYEHLEHLRDWRAAATLNFPLFDAGIRRRQVETTELQIQQNQETIEDLKRSIALETRQSYLNLTRAVKATEIAEKQVTNARLNLDVTKGRYELERAFLLELLQAQTDYASALTNRVRSFYEYKIARTELQRSMGDL